jgi:TnpA family transposase
LGSTLEIATTHPRGLLVVPHIETNAFCIYSQLKSFSSSEIAAIIEGPFFAIEARS